MQAGIPRNQSSSIIHTNGSTIKVATKEDEPQRFEAFRMLGRAKRKLWGEVIEGKEIVVERKDICDQPQGKHKNSRRGYSGLKVNGEDNLLSR